MLSVYSYSPSADVMPAKLQFLLSVPLFVSAGTDAAAIAVPSFFAVRVTFAAL